MTIRPQKIRPLDIARNVIELKRCNQEVLTTGIQSLPEYLILITEYGDAKFSISFHNGNQLTKH